LCVFVWVASEEDQARVYEERSGAKIG
jgi:hypothetical protein